PAVIAAADAVRFDAPELERGAAMRAVPLEQAEPAVGLAEQDEILGQQPDRHRRIRDLLGEPDRPPIAAQQRAHRRAGPDPRQPLVFLPVHASSAGATVHGSAAARRPAIAGYFIASLARAT